MKQEKTAQENRKSSLWEKIKKKSQKNSYLIPGLKKLKTNMKGMSFSQKVDHIWTYFKEYILVGILLAVMVFGMVSSLLSTRREAVITGVMANLSMSQKGYSYLSTDYEKLVATGKNQYVSFQYVNFESLENSAQVEASYAAAMKPVAMAVNRELDYILMNETALKFYMAYDFFLDLREFFTPEEMEQWESRVIYYSVVDSLTGEETDAIPVAINLEGLAFKTDTIGEGEAYLSFLNEPDRMERYRQFWEYLNAWEPETK